MLSARDILKITLADARSLFPGPDQDVKHAYRNMAKVWHPDISRDPLASKVLAHLTFLRDGIVTRRAEAAGTLKEKIYVTTDGKKIRFKYLSIRPGDFGDILVGSKTIAYEVPSEFADVVANEQERIGALRFANDGMKAQMQHFLPVIEKVVETSDRIVTILKRPADCVLLTDLIAHFSGSIPAVHVAWIVSSLENMCCYLGYLGIAHGAISPSNILVCPERHSIVLVGGWGFATEFGKRPLALPERTASRIPGLAVAGSTVDAKTDLTLIRATAQDALGSSGGGGLMMDKSVPEQVARWLLLPPKGSAQSDYESWGVCLTEAWGKRTFVKMDADPRKIYAN